MELWTDGAPLVFTSELLRNLKFEDGGAPDLNQISYKLRTAGMEPWTDGAPLIFKSELLRTLKFEDRTAGMEPWTDGARLICKSELLQVNFVLRGWSLGLMGRP